ncbi:MAG: hypothetical protein WAV92_06235, partial [Halopseudomonas yangmingensis]
MSWPVIKFSEAISRSGLFSDGDWVESKDQDPEGDVRLIQLADIGVGEFIDKSNRFMTSKRADELRCSYLKAGDILVARMPDPIGRACIFPEDMGKRQQISTCYPFNFHTTLIPSSPTRGIKYGHAAANRLLATTT